MIQRFFVRGARIALLAALLLATFPAQAANPQQVAQGTPYTVRSGDTWSRIAGMFGVSADRLIDYNGLRSRPDLIFIGEVIRIPITVGTTPSYVSPFFYAVLTGDTVQSIVDKFELDKSAFLSANALVSDSAALTAGEVLLIPAGPHRVVIDAGETLADVAARYETTVSRLLQFNPHIVNASTVFPGNNVFVPVKYNAAFVPATNLTGSAPTTTTAEPTSAIPAATVGTQVTDAITAKDGTTEYVVQRGDTWVRIQNIFGVDAATLIDSNGLRSRPNLLFAGETITIPITLGFAPSFVNPFLYTAQAGDTIQALITTFEIDKSALLSANNLSSALDNNTPLTPDETLLIPAGPHRTTVKAGETLQSIADRYSTTVSRIQAFNAHLSEPLLVGQNIYIPVQLNAAFVPATGLDIESSA